MHTFDIIVIGSGIAGLSFAHRAALEGFQVGIITKKTGTESNTNYAQGGFHVSLLQVMTLRAMSMIHLMPETVFVMKRLYVL